MNLPHRFRSVCRILDGGCNVFELPLRKVWIFARLPCDSSVETLIHYVEIIRGIFWIAHAHHPDCRYRAGFFGQGHYLRPLWLGHFVIFKGNAPPTVAQITRIQPNLSVSWAMDNTISQNKEPNQDRSPSEVASAKGDDLIGSTGASTVGQNIVWLLAHFIITLRGDNCSRRFERMPLPVFRLWTNGERDANVLIW
jgi:hypothetical protein